LCQEKKPPVKYLTRDRYDYASCAVVRENGISYLDDVASDPQHLLMERSYDAE
jgi:hypothetical protein